jgi:hypothetical protein
VDNELIRPCPRCNAAMTPGQLRTTTRGSFWVNWGWAVAGSNRVRWEGDGGPYRVAAFRCPSCGVVEMAATERPGSSSGCLGMVLLVAGLGLGVCVAAGQLLAG